MKIQANEVDHQSWVGFNHGGSEICVCGLHQTLGHDALG